MYNNYIISVIYSIYIYKYLENKLKTTDLE